MQNVKPYLILLAPFALAFVVGVSFSRYYWGYYVNRPSPLPQLKQLESVSAVYPVFPPDDAQSRRLWGAPELGSLIEECKDTTNRDERYYALTERAICALQKQGLLPERYADETAEYGAILELVALARIPTNTQGSLEYTDKLSGVRIDGVDSKGQKWTFLSLQTGEISNDRFAFYETGFRQDASGEWELVARQQFFWEDAGIEGFNWFWVFLLVLIPASAIVGLTLCIVAIVRMGK